MHGVLEAGPTFQSGMSSDCSREVVPAKWIHQRWRQILYPVTVVVVFATAVMMTTVTASSCFVDEVSFTVKSYSGIKLIFPREFASIQSYAHMQDITLFYSHLFHILYGTCKITGFFHVPLEYQKWLYCTLEIPRVLLAYEVAFMLALHTPPSIRATTYHQTNMKTLIREKTHVYPPTLLCVLSDING